MQNIKKKWRRKRKKEKKKKKKKKKIAKRNRTGLYRGSYMVYMYMTVTGSTWRLLESSHVHVHTLTATFIP